MQRKAPKIRNVTKEELSSALGRAKEALTSEDYEIFEGLVATLALIKETVEKKNARLRQLMKQILGIKSEKSAKVFEQIEAKEEKRETENDDDSPSIEDKRETENSDDSFSMKDSERKRKGHGRNSAEKYTGAKKEEIKHTVLESGCLCPGCARGKVYRENPGVFIHIEGQPPIQATIYETEKYRCNLCGEIYEADLPEEVPDARDNSRKHYDATAKSMIAILRYGYGLPLNRLEKLQGGLGIPLPAATAWDKTQEVAKEILPVYEELTRIAAQGDIIYNDDTGMKILQTMKDIAKEVQEADGKKTRTGIFTTGIVSTVEDKKIALFFTGRKHAGENFDDLLNQRESDRSPPLQMCDGKKGNTLESTSSIACNCNAHARRYFVEVSENFPEECMYVLLEVYRNIYKNDAHAKKHNMSPQQRLEHQKNSAPVMEKFHLWLKRQFDEKLVEENSGLGKAIAYVMNRWSQLARFLHEPGAPLDNNICERLLKRAICHRKNSLFYKTANGARIGDMFMGIIHTCYYAGVNPFDYLTKLQKYSSKVIHEPAKWLPWNYSLQLGLNF